MLISDLKVNNLTCNKRLISEKFISHNGISDVKLILKETNM